MKNYYIYFFIPVLLIGTFSSCSPQQNTQKVIDGKVSLQQFKTKLSNVSNPQLIDVRTPGEVEGGTIEGATNMDFNAQTFESQLNTLNKNQPVFIFCQSGGRSGQSYSIMKKMGFSEVYDLEGGYMEWSKQ